MELKRGNSGTERTISRRLVAIFKDHVGRGPTTARTFLGDDLVVVVLKDTLTKAERTLADDERPGLVRELRRTFQGTMKNAMLEVIEEETGRKVAAFLSDHSIEPDYAAEVFILADADADGDGDGRRTGDGETLRANDVDGDHPDAAVQVPDAVRSGNSDQR